MSSQYTIRSSPDDKSHKLISRGCFRFLYRPRVFLVIVLVAVGGSLVVLFQLFKNHREFSVQLEPQVPIADTEKQLEIIPTISAPFASNPQSQWVKSFDTETRPSWMDLPLPDKPLAFRVAVMSHPNEVKRRQLLRDNMFRGVRPSEINLAYRFVLGLPNNVPAENKMDTLREEQEKHGDLEIMDIDDAFDKLSQKRYHAFKWVRRSYCFLRYKCGLTRLIGRLSPSQMQVTTILWPLIPIRLFDSGRWLADFQQFWKEKMLILEKILLWWREWAHIGGIG